MKLQRQGLFSLLPHLAHNMQFQNKPLPNYMIESVKKVLSIIIIIIHLKL